MEFTHMKHKTTETSTHAQLYIKINHNLDENIYTIQARDLQHLQYNIIFIQYHITLIIDMHSIHDDR